jgi:hypothetical protein
MRRTTSFKKEEQPMGKRILLDPFGNVVPKEFKVGKVLFGGDTAKVSRHHASVGISPRGDIWVAEVGSTNGILLDGVPLSTERLKYYALSPALVPGATMPLNTKESSRCLFGIRFLDDDPAKHTVRFGSRGSETGHGFDFVRQQPTNEQLAAGVEEVIQIVLVGGLHRDVTEHTLHDE